MMIPDDGQHLDPDLLSALAEGDAAPDDAERARDHLAMCERCRGEVQWIRTLREAAAGLPRQVEPSRDLFPGIRARIEAGHVPETAPTPRAPRRLVERFHAGWLAAAAVLLVTISSAITLELTQRRATGSAETAPAALSGSPGEELSGGVLPATDPAGTMAAAWRPTLLELESALSRSRDRLAPETVEVIEGNLAIIDQAIREASEALARDPGSREALQSLNAMYATRAQVLRQASGLPGGA